MSLRFALLALLSVDAMTGYDLHKRFDSSVGHVWYAPDSQIYPELRKMEADGVVRAEEVAWGPKGTKREYHITDEGRTALREWMNAMLPYARFRDAMHLKSAYFEWATPDAARAQLRAHIAHYEAELAQWEEQIIQINTSTSPMLNRRLAVTPEADRARTTAFKRFAYEGLVQRAQQEIAWARNGLTLIDDLDNLDEKEEGR
ncbi:MAG: PadR family transcriptional regulator [Pseudolysinimonas sp.]|uniref:PadR family transcriptional regulator n=1 Tax=Pseudolysinimonas sp. TaxID=2680009 RepID=UPI003264044D